ncbi:hypothetical protein PG988_015959 [Apiospora saccharicola]
MFTSSTASRSSSARRIKKDNPGTTCGGDFLNTKHAYSDHKYKSHHGQALMGPSVDSGTGTGTGAVRRRGNAVKHGPTRHEIKNRTISIECKHCPNSKITTPNSLTAHYRRDKVKHLNKTTEAQVFGEYPKLAYLLPAKRETSTEEAKN